MRITDKATATDSQRVITKDGYMVVPATISRVGVFDYLDTELGVGNKQEIKKVARTEKSLFSDESIKSFEGVPITIEHPAEGVNAQNWKKLSVGNVRNVKRVGDTLAAEAWIYDAQAISVIQQGGIEQLSCGYDCNLTDSPSEGIDYEMTPMLGNHVAIVAKGRCGVSVKLADKGLKMSKSVKLLDSLLGVFGIKLSDEQKQKIEEEEKKGDAPTGEGAGTQEEKKEPPKEPPKSEDKKEEDKEDKKVNDTNAALLAEVASLRKQLADQEAERKAEKERVTVLADAKATFPSLKITDADTVRQIKEKAIIDCAMYSQDELKAMNDAAIDVIYDVAKKQTAKSVNDGVGKGLMQDADKTAPASIDFNKLYAKE